MRLAAAAAASGLAGLAATSWTALTLAELGHFTAIVPIAVFPVVAALCFRWLRRGRPDGTRAIEPEDVAAVAIACATLLLTLPPDETLLGGQDPGVYVHTAAAVARSGSLRIDAPDLATFGKDGRQLLFRKLGQVYMPFQGMFELPDGRLAPQFYHLYPSLMAVAWAIGGVRAALAVNPLLNVAAVIALYALAAMLLGRRWALAAALVHALGTAQLRQAKFPTAEMATQLFLLGGMALLAAALREDDPEPALAPLAGASLGMAALARYDSVMFLVPLAVVLLWGMGPAGKSRPVLLALGTTGVLWCQSSVHQRAFSPYYQPVGGLVGAASIAAALGLAALLLLRRSAAGRRFREAISRRETALRVAAAAALCSWVLFGWLVRPRLAGGGRVGHLFRLLSDGLPFQGIFALLSGPESVNMLYLVDVLGALGLVAAVGGVCALVVTRRGLWESAWLAASSAALVVLTLDVFHDHFLMWVSRRFVPAVVPLASVGIAAAAASLARRPRGNPRVLAAAAAALVVAAVALNAGAIGAMAREREWPGLVDWSRRLAAVVPPDAELYSDQPGFAAAARFVLGRKAYELGGPNERRRERLLGLMRRRAKGGAEVLFLTEGRAGEQPPPGLAPVGSLPLASSTILGTRRGVPRETRPRGGDFVLYRVLPPS
ncbi:MAG TPA: hypothetical protein VI078_08735 [bacterium]